MLSDMSGSFSRARDRAIAIAYIPRATRRLRRGGQSQQRLAGILANVHRRGSAGEAAWIGAIEQHRRELERSTSTVRFGTLRPRSGIVGTLAKRASKSPIWGRLLLRLALAYQPTNMLELGTAFGISAAYQGAALALNGAGHLVTIEGNPEVAAHARRMIEDLGLSPRIEVRNGRFEDEMDGVLAGGVDWAFIDGNHEEAATMAYFEKVLAALQPPGVIIFDDIRWSAGMRRAWDRIASDQRLTAAADAGQLGICIV